MFESVFDDPKSGLRLLYEGIVLRAPVQLGRQTNRLLFLIFYHR